MNIDSQEFVKQLENDFITHISFMMDYLAIGFNVGTLTAVIPPSIMEGDELWQWRKPGYNEKIISLIQIKVSTVVFNETEKYLSLKLENSVEILLSWNDPPVNVSETFILNINSEVLIK
jgi:hypothetical protein